MEAGDVSVPACKYWTPLGMIPFSMTRFCPCILNTVLIGVFNFQVNCYSLHSVGPSVEKFGGTQRFFTIYFASAVASKD